jgi:hypothetical protein
MGTWRSLASAGGQGPAGRNPRARVLDRDALGDILVGCSYLGCGGGRTLAEGRARLADDLAKGLRFELLGVDTASVSVSGHIRRAWLKRVPPPAAGMDAGTHAARWISTPVMRYA